MLPPSSRVKSKRSRSTVRRPGVCRRNREVMRVRYWSSGSAYVSGCGKTASKKRKTTAPEGRRPGHRRCDVASERAHRRHPDRAVVGNVRLQAGAALLARHGFVRLHEPLLVQRLARSEEHTSELQSLMRISYAVF